MTNMDLQNMSSDFRDTWHYEGSWTLSGLCCMETAGVLLCWPVLVDSRKWDTRWGVMPLNPLSTLIYTAEYKADISSERDVKCLDFSQRKQLQNRLAFETGKTAWTKDEMIFGDLWGRDVEQCERWEGLSECRRHRNEWRRKIHPKQEAWQGRRETWALADYCTSADGVWFCSGQPVLFSCALDPIWL